MTYCVNGVHYIAFMAGNGGGELGVPLPEQSAAYRYGNEGRIIALILGGRVPKLPAEVSLRPFPTPPADKGDLAQISQGEILYGRFCADPMCWDAESCRTFAA